MVQWLGANQRLKRCSLNSLCGFRQDTQPDIHTAKCQNTAFQCSQRQSASWRKCQRKKQNLCVWKLGFSFQNVFGKKAPKWGQLRKKPPNNNYITFQHLPCTKQGKNKAFHTYPERDYIFSFVSHRNCTFRFSSIWSWVSPRSKL